MGESTKRSVVPPPSTAMHASAIAMATDPEMARRHAERSILAADVGGTHARIGLVASGKAGQEPVRMLHCHRYNCCDWPGLTAMLQDFVVQLSSTPHRQAAVDIEDCAIACAGYVLDDTIVNKNLPWPMSIRAIRADLGIRHLVVINDFEATAYATQFIHASDTHTIIEAPTPAAGGPVLVMGPGTGLGSAVLLPGASHAQVLPTEAGQISLAPGTEREIEILRVLRRERSHVSFEDALSGPGLLKLYGALCKLRGVAPRWLTPADVTKAAMANTDGAALETMEVFCGLLGGFVGDMTLLYGARGGVYLAGGILPRIRSFLRASTFAERFFDKGVMQAFLKKVPVRLVEDNELGVFGAGAWFFDHEREVGHDQ